MNAARVRMVRLPPMRRTTAVLALLAALLALVAAGCGGGEEITATPETVEGTLPETTQPSSEDLPALELEGNAEAGKGTYVSAGCGGCHTLAAADSTGTVGPNLDQSKPTYELAVERVTKGRGSMPPFGDRLKPQEIADVSQYVVDSTSGG